MAPTSSSSGGILGFFAVYQHILRNVGTEVSMTIAWKHRKCLIAAIIYYAFFRQNVGTVVTKQLHWNNCDVCIDVIMHG